MAESLPQAQSPRQNSAPITIRCLRIRIYLEPNGDEIKYTIITSGSENVEGILNFDLNLETLSTRYLSVLFSHHLNNLDRQLIETEILNELLERGHISRFSNYKDYLGGVCISNGYADLLVMEYAASTIQSPVLQSPIDL